jgi:Icc-related predicted phosphoesterase
MKFLYVTDVHGDPEIIEKLLKEGERKSIKAIVIGGDICPGFEIYGQRFFLEFYLVPRLLKFVKKSRKLVFGMMGNDDFGLNLDVLQKAEEMGILKIIHSKIHKLNHSNITGYPFVNPTPFMFKEWEKEEREITKDMNKLKKKSDPEKTIYVFHAPPFRTKLDVLYSGEHTGSKAIRKFIEKEQPLLTLHGHIHESFVMSGSFQQRIGKTLCLNPGSGKIAEIDLDGLKARIIK